MHITKSRFTHNILFVQNHNVWQPFLALSQSDRVADDAEVRYTSWLHGFPAELYGDVECMSLCINSGIASETNGWRAEKCTQDQSVGVVCHKGRLSRRLTSQNRYLRS